MDNLIGLSVGAAPRHDSAEQLRFRPGLQLRRTEGLPQGDDATLLDQLHDLNARLSGLIARLTSDMPAAASGAAPVLDTPPPAGPRPIELKQLLQLRARRRRNPFGQFLDWPAWDMLLDLAAVKAEGGHVSVSAVCISSGAPQSTALRKLAALESANLVRRYLHGTDRRRVCLTLTNDGLMLVNALLAEEAHFYAEHAIGGARRLAANDVRGAEPQRDRPLLGSPR